MSTSSRAPSAPARTELETVVNWPLLLTAAGLGFLILAVPAVLACIAASKGDVVKDEVVSRRELPPADAAPVATPARTLASFTPPAEAETPLPVFREGRQRNKPAPAPTPSAVAAKPPPLDPILMGPEVTEPLPPPFKRLDELSEEALVKSLTEQAKGVDLENVRGTREKLLAGPRERGRDRKSLSPILSLCRDRDDLKGLPMIGEADCRAKEETVRKMAAISQKLRRFVQPRPGHLTYDTYYPTQCLSPAVAEQKGWMEDDGLTTMVQMLQVDEPPVRMSLVELLARGDGAGSRRLLARHALFDFSRDVRKKAIDMLKKRSPRGCREELLAGLRYPWPPVAAHAAEALVALNDRAAVPRLIAVLDEPDPCAPVQEGGKWVVKEVARINHLRNCLLCHAPSYSAEDSVRGLVPKPGQRLPQAYYASRSGDFVRADVTYLRQDFSLMERVAKPEKWPALQRFDYVVRTRELTPDERAAHEKKAPAGWPACYPQRDAVLFALRELTGLDAGDNAADWCEILCATETDGGH